MSCVLVPLRQIYAYVATRYVQGEDVSSSPGFELRRAYALRRELESLD